MIENMNHIDEPMIRFDPVEYYQKFQQDPAEQIVNSRCIQSSIPYIPSYQLYFVVLSTGRIIWWYDNDTIRAYQIRMGYIAHNERD